MRSWHVVKSNARAEEVFRKKKFSQAGAPHTHVVFLLGEI